MTSIVEIIPTDDTITCEEGSSCTFDFTFTNICNRKLGVGFKVIPEGETQVGWLKFDDSPRDLDKAETDKITVEALIPPGAAPGKYKFRLCVFSVTNPSENYTDSNSVMIDVKAKPVVEKKDTGGIPWWIPVSIVMVLLTGGGVAWWALSKPGEDPTPQQAEVLVPKVTGQSLEEARSEIESAGLQVGKVENQPTEEVAPNAVWKTVPPAKTRVKKGAAIDVIVAQMPQVGVPDLIGRPVATAKTSIMNAGLTVGAVTEQATNDVPAGFVIGQMPIPPGKIARGEAVALSVSVAPPPPRPGISRPFHIYQVPLTVQKQFLLRGVKPEPEKKP